MTNVNTPNDLRDAMRERERERQDKEDKEEQEEEEEEEGGGNAPHVNAAAVRCATQHFRCHVRRGAHKRHELHTININTVASPRASLLHYLG